MQNRKAILLSGAALVAMGALCASATRAHAQTANAAPQQSAAAKKAGSNVLEEVVVTAARRRNESVQTTPIAATALTPALLERSQVSQLVDVAKLVPNLQMNYIAGGGSPEQLSLYLRGFGTGEVDPDQDPAIPVVVDGAVISSVTSSNLDIFGISRIEVLRGPQGTLFGKNAPTGVINVTTLRPDLTTYSGKVQVDYGSYNKAEERILVNLPIVENQFAINISAIKKNMDNWGYNVVTHEDQAGGIDNESLRIGALWRPSDLINWYVDGQVYEDNSPPVEERSGADTEFDPPFAYPQAICVIAKICTPNPPLSSHYEYASPADSTNHEKVRNYSITSNLDVKFEPVTLSFVTAYQNRYFDIPGDDATRVGFNWLNNYQAGKINDVSQEVRIASNKGGGTTLGDRIDWVLGGYYDENHTRFADQIDLYQNFADVALGLPAGTFPAGSEDQSNQRETQQTTSYAVFAHVVGNITDKWNVSFGGRQSWDSKTHSAQTSFDPGLLAYNPAPAYGPTTNVSASWSNFSVEAGTQYRFTPDKMVYFRYAQGYRSGGIQTTPPPAGLGVPQIYNPETVDTYEVGAKADWLDHALRTNLTMFESDYSNLQRDLSFFVGGGVQQDIVNAAEARVRGIELETIAVPVPELTLRVNLGYLDPEYLRYTGLLFNGVVPPGTPAYNPDLNLGQKFPFAPKWTVDAGFDYTHDWAERGVTTLSMNLDYKSSESLYDVTVPDSIQGGFFLLNASVRWESASGKYSVTLYGHNITNTYYHTYFAPALGNIIAEGMPATVGVSLGAKF